jgi:RNA polymerase sigma-54 factor
VGDEYLIVLNDEGLPRLKVSSDYEEIIERDSGAPAETKNYIKDKLRDALWLIKSMQQRQRTIYRVVESLLKFQKNFFEKGAEHLKPLVLRDVAEDIEMHESTVSRVTTNKYMHTPQGIFELKYFFSTAIPQTDGESLAAESIRQKIKAMIKNENPDKPLTDNAISKLLAEENIKVARRTVAKYREQLGILPVKHRRKPKM